MNLEHVRALAQSEAPLPPIIVHGRTNRVIDGMHRLQAAKLNGADEIEAVIFDGDDEDAFILAVESNIEHGLPLSLAERSTAAERIIRARPDWSDRAVALSTGVSAKTVSAIRSRIARDIPTATRRIGMDGRVRPVDSTSGRRAAAELLAADPSLSLRKVAKESGVSPSTVRDVRERLDRGDNPVPPTYRVAPKPDPAEPPAQNDDKGPPSNPADVAHSLSNLRSDPAVRFNECGRMLLRLLDPQFITADAHERLLDAVPPYWAGDLAGIARAYASAWNHFANALEDMEPTQDS
ncbi:ParB/RepB/Spo0J family partition protein [Actinocrispum wychmicini]|uniref:ParB/RepB/Spo0J family partition protein n=1 Tax=Actinocrispum wychmicini TaxID=1213861 RepID=UPI001FB65986|nr:ParB N-terminal domain-containing protein [Actinocrispum wychmicini]